METFIRSDAVGTLWLYGKVVDKYGKVLVMPLHPVNSPHSATKRYFYNGTVVYP